MTGRYLLGLAVLALAVLAILGVAHLEVDNRLERWTGDDRDEAETYRRFRESFGSDELVVVAISGPKVLDSVTLRRLQPVVEELRQIEGIQRVQGLPLVLQDVYGDREEDLEAFIADATATPFYRGLFLSPDNSVLGLVVETIPPDDPGGRRILVTRLQEVLAPLLGDGYQVDVVGSPVLAAALDRVSLVEGRRSAVLALVFSLVLLGVLLRSFRSMLVAATCATTNVLLTLGAMALAGRSLNMITSALPALLGVLSLAGSVHLLRRYQDLANEMSRADALREALHEMTRPITVASLTTALGFGSLVLADMAPVREFGALAALGMVGSLAVNLTVGPTLVVLFRLPARPSRLKAPLARLASLAEIHPKAIVTVFAFLVLGLLALVVAPGVRVASNPLSFLPRDDPTTAAYQRVGQSLTGFFTMEVILDLPEAWWQPETTALVSRVAESIEQSPSVARVLSPVDLLCQLSFWQSGSDPRAYKVPVNSYQARLLVAFLEAADSGALHSLATADGESVRLSAIVRTMDEEAFLELVDKTRKTLDTLPEGYRGVVTGMVLRLVSAQYLLIHTQLKSLALAIVLVVIAMGVGLGSWRLAILALAPNLLPIVGIFGIMALLRIPLDAATATVASIALGIGVDDAVHYLQAFSRRRESRTTAEALRVTMVDVGPALMVTTATAGLGFGLLSSSAFVPIRHFAVLSTAALVLALLADMVLVPAVLTLNSGADPRGTPSSEQGGCGELDQLPQ